MPLEGRVGGHHLAPLEGSQTASRQRTPNNRQPEEQPTKKPGQKGESLGCKYAILQDKPKHSWIS